MVAEAPGWDYALSDTARFVLGHRLPSVFVPPSEPLGEQAFSALMDECERHRLGGLLIDAVATGVLPATDFQCDQMCRAELAATSTRLGYEQIVSRILEALDARGIEVRVLKGLAVARLDYPDEQWRPTGDLDVLVRAERLADSVRALEHAGGAWLDPEPTPGWNRLVGKGATVEFTDPSFEVDVHRILVWGPFGVRVPDDALWARSRTFQLAGIERATLGLEETLLHLCAHLLVLGVTRAREARDVAQLLVADQLDPQRVARLADAWGHQALVATAIRFAERECGLRPDAHPLSRWAREVRVSRRDALWMRAGAPEPQRVRGVEQFGVFIELGRVPDTWTRRKVLLRANFRPAPGTYPGPWSRLAAVVGIGGSRHG